VLEGPTREVDNDGVYSNLESVEKWLDDTVLKDTVPIRLLPKFH